MKPKLSDVLFILGTNLAMFLCIAIACYMVGLPAWVASILSVIAILAYTRYAVRLMLRRGD